MIEICKNLNLIKNLQNRCCKIDNNDKILYYTENMRSSKTLGSRQWILPRKKRMESRKRCILA